MKVTLMSTTADKFQSVKSGPIRIRSAVRMLQSAAMTAEQYNWKRFERVSVAQSYSA